MPDASHCLGQTWLSTWGFFNSDYLWVLSPFYFIIVCLFDYIVSLRWYFAKVRKPSFELVICCTLTTTESRAKRWYCYNARKPSPRGLCFNPFSVVVFRWFILCTFHCWWWFIVWYALLCVFSRFAIFWTRNRELIALLCFNCVPYVLFLLIFCGSSTRCHGLVYVVWLWYSMIILTYFCHRNLSLTAL